MHMAGMATIPRFEELVRTSLARKPDYEVVGTTSLSDGELKELQEAMRGGSKTKWRKWGKEEIEKLRDAVRDKYSNPNDGPL